jgi:hypothetical protein
LHFRLPKQMRNWREFAREVTIVVIGVLIAIGLDQLVEHHHWQQKIERAEGTMRIELSGDDGPQAYVRLAIAPCLDAEILALNSAAETMPAPKLRTLANSYSPPLRTWESQGWAAVQTSDIGSHMSSDRLAAWSEPYLLIASMNDWNLREGELTTDLREALPSAGDASPAQRQDLRRIAAELRDLNANLGAGARLLLTGMHDNAIDLPGSRKAELLREARARYGACVREPQPGGIAELTQFTGIDDLRRFALGGH